MTTKHTPTPWRVKRLANYEEHGHVILWSDKSGEHMRRLDHNGNFTEHDAKLIAAAPQLLAAAIAVVERWDTPNWKDVPATAEYINQLRAAIARATDTNPPTS